MKIYRNLIKYIFKPLFKFLKIVYNSSIKIRKNIMLLHLGKDQMVFKKDIAFILDYCELIKNNDGIAFLNALEENAKVIHIDKYDIKAVILVNIEQKMVLYYSPIKTKTLFKRAYDRIENYSIVQNFECLKWDDNL
jgi:hypothetical protein